MVSSDVVTRWIRGGAFRRHLFRYRRARLLTYRLDVVARPFLTAAMLRLLSRGTSDFEDDQGRCLPITVGTLLRLFWQLLLDVIRKPFVLRRVRREVSDLAAQRTARHSGRYVDLAAAPVYLRTDLVFGLRSGGSVGHIAGVLNHLDRFTGRPVFLTTDGIPTVRQDLETHVVAPTAFWDFQGLPALAFHIGFVEQARRRLGDRRLGFIYQRYCLYSYAGVKVSRAYSVPFVLEYNGSEIWVSRNWGQRLRYEGLAERIELLNLKAADVVVVVSRPLREELAARGIAPEKILVNPNGVDPERYSPAVDGSPVRDRYHLHGKTVIGFIGTFGKWHGAEVLAQAYGLLMQQFPAYREQVRLLMIGDGVTMPLVRERLAAAGMADICVFTGLVPQEQGPAHLAACDILSSPQVPNPDGTAFFGSPTKLFEYMAMGKGIVASDLDQIGEVLAHGRTGWLVEPGDPQALADGLRVLIDDVQMRTRLGEAARHEVLARYTWQSHTRRIIEKLKERCGWPSSSTFAEP